MNERITFNPKQRGGRPCIRGMRITVKDVLEYLAGGMSREEILHDFPYLEDEDITACLDYAANYDRYLKKDALKMTGGYLTEADGDFVAAVEEAGKDSIPDMDGR